MSEPSRYPEFPYPFPPGREPPERSDPLVVPVVDRSAGLLWDSLAEQRRILVSGPLDQRAVTEVSARLMALDGSSSRDVEIIIASPGGPVPEVLPVLDVLGLMRSKVNVTAIGSVGGTAVALVASCSGERRAAAHATFSFRIDVTQSIEGTARDIVHRADELSRLWHGYVAALAAATGQDEQVLADEIDHGGTHSADEAMAWGIIDATAARS